MCILAFSDPPPPRPYCKSHPSVGAKGAQLSVAAFQVWCGCSLNDCTSSKGESEKNGRGFQNILRKFGAHLRAPSLNTKAAKLDLRKCSIYSLFFQMVLVRRLFVPTGSFGFEGKEGFLNDFWELVFRWVSANFLEAWSCPFYSLYKLKGKSIVESTSFLAYPL